MGIKVEGIADGVAYLCGLGLGPIVAIVVRVLGIAVQDRGLIYIQTVVTYIKVHVTYHQELVSDAVRLGTLLERCLEGVSWLFSYY